MEPFFFVWSNTHRNNTVCAHTTKMKERTPRKKQKKILSRLLLLSLFFFLLPVHHIPLMLAATSSFLILFPSLFSFRLTPSPLSRDRIGVKRGAVGRGKEEGKKTTAREEVTIHTRRRQKKSTHTHGFFFSFLSLSLSLKCFSEKRGSSPCPFSLVFYAHCSGALRSE